MNHTPETPTMRLEAEAKTLFERLRLVDLELRTHGRCMVLNECLTAEGTLHQLVRINGVLFAMGAASIRSRTLPGAVQPHQEAS
jgi:hypothetical protein